MKNLLSAFSITYIIVLIASGCKKEDDFESSTQFLVSIEGMDPITFYNPECEFAMDELNQSQFNGYGGPELFQYFSSYWNGHSPDSILNQIWIDLSFLGANHSTESVASTLEKEHDSNDNNHFFVKIQMDLNGTRYSNRLVDNDPNTFGYETSDSCYYRINLFDGDYHIKCLDKDVIAINLDFNGKLYAYDSIIKIDSIEVRGENLNLLFARD